MPCPECLAEPTSADRSGARIRHEGLEFLHGDPRLLTSLFRCRACGTYWELGPVNGLPRTLPLEEARRSYRAFAGTNPLVYFTFTCAGCRQRFEAPETAGTYGEFCMRGEHEDTPAFLDAILDPVFKEVSGILRRVDAHAARDPLKASDLLHAIFGVACDPAPDGSRLAIARNARCPACGTRKMHSWAPARRPYDGPLLAVTHREWSSMDASRREQVVRDAVAGLDLPRGGPPSGGHR